MPIPDFKVSDRRKYMLRFMLHLFYIQSDKYSFLFREKTVCDGNAEEEQEEHAVSAQMLRRWEHRRPWWLPVHNWLFFCLLHEWQKRRSVAASLDPEAIVTQVWRSAGGGDLELILSHLTSPFCIAVIDSSTIRVWACLNVCVWTSHNAVCYIHLFGIETVISSLHEETQDSWWTTLTGFRLDSKWTKCCAPSHLNNTTNALQKSIFVSLFTISQISKHS